MRIAAIAILLIASTTAVRSQTLDADEAAAHLDFDRARQLYRAAIEHEPDAKQRDRAAVRLGNIEWRLDHDADKAERDLARVADDSEQAAAAWIERARLAADLREDFRASAAAAQHAMKVANSPIDLGRAAYLHANALMEPARRARRGGRCDEAVADLQQAELEMTTLAAKAGPLPAIARQLLDAALLSNDGPAALDAWRGYYGPTAHSTLLARAATTLAHDLPAWRSSAVPAAERRAIGLALADSRLFAEAAMVLSDPCAKDNMPTDDPRVAETIAYANAMRSFSKAVDEYYRKLALHEAKPADLDQIADSSARALWNELEPRDKPRAFSESALQEVLDKRFGTYASIGWTSKMYDAHLAHAVIDEQREVTQYGRTAPLRFIALDGIVSNGFWSWIHDGQSGDGGWATATAVYQVRPLYASGPYDLWLRYADPQGRAKTDRDTQEESRRDEQRLANDPNLLPAGVAMRFRMQYVDQVLRDLDAQHLEGDAKRDAFVERVTRDEFESSIWAHEGRHAIDKKFKLVPTGNGPEMEFRAKLSEVAFAPAPRAAMNAVSYDAPANTPHGAANRRIGALLTQWMRDHRASIAGLDENTPMLLQADKLTDDQLRQAFRSMDPLAR
jgi:hypothetical protein